jgi:hypothetical protein
VTLLTARGAKRIGGSGAVTPNPYIRTAAALARGRENELHRPPVSSVPVPPGFPGAGAGQATEGHGGIRYVARP